MIVHINEFFKLKPEVVPTFTNKVFHIIPNPMYRGEAKVYAKSIEEANVLIQKFKDGDKNNKRDSFGYCFVEEFNFFGEYTDEPTGLDAGGIYYCG